MPNSNPEAGMRGAPIVRVLLAGAAIVIAILLWRWSADTPGPGPAPSPATSTDAPKDVRQAPPSPEPKSPPAAKP